MLRPVGVSHHSGIAAGALFSDTIRQGAGQGSQSPPSSRTLNSSRRNESKGEQAVETQGRRQKKPSVTGSPVLPSADGPLCPL